MRRVLPIEVWDLPVGGRLLQQWRHDPSFPARVVEAIAAIRTAPPSQWSVAAREVGRALAHVHIAGGGAGEVVAAIAARWSCTSSRDPFAAARAGTSPGVLGADVGQTAIKLALGERTWRVERDPVRAPLRDTVPPAQRAAARASTIDFLGEVLAGHAPAALLALPCEIVDGVPRSCTYCWPDPDPALTAALAARAGCAISIVNDAELAARAALPQLPAVPALVLTIGFGVGGALVTA
jgi:hypothetical protein